MSPTPPPVPYFFHRLRLAYSGLHPERIHTLVKASDPVEAVRKIETGRVRVSAAAREAVGVAAEQRMQELASSGVSVTLLGADSYPPWLAAIPDPPDLLFVRGVLPTAPGVAVVGSRRATRYGINLAKAIGAAAGRRDAVVVSGLARGIDGAAHWGVVEAGGRGVAVLGCGLDRWYPVSHRRLGEALLENGGGVVTEYPPGTVPEPWRFPVRNRIITGLSRVVLVVEAAADGGALISARLGLEQGREVLAVPGDIDRVTSRGCNELIRDGAMPVLGTADVLDLLEQEGIINPSGVGRRESGPADAKGGLEEAIGEAGATLEVLAERMGWPLTRLLVSVGELESEGRVTRDGGVIRLRMEHGRNG
ncbi:MAG: DNA-processing protein DprA [bacterium]|nr:DNA-processing protein DprA [bacterium]MDE0602511.1 DNA-processing protein DprA [bacterium]